MFKIDKNKPFTSKSSKYPFKDMKKGDSFLVPLKDVEDRVETRIERARVLAASFQSKIKIKTRTIVEESGIRVWLK